MRKNNVLRKYIASLLLFLLFETVAITLWKAKGNLFYLLNFSYIGGCLALGTALFTAGKRYTRHFLGVFKTATIHGRAEDFARQADYREQFDLCVSRAVANLSTLSEYCLPYVKVGGFFVSYKSGDIVDELSAAKTAVHVLGGTQNKPVVFQLPGSDISRSFVKIKKIKPTGKKFPRKAGLPSKEPIHG